MSYILGKTIVNNVSDKWIKNWLKNTDIVMITVQVKEKKNWIKTQHDITQHKSGYIRSDCEEWLLLTACTSYEIRMYSYLLILTQCRNCNKDKWQKKYEVDVREGKLEIINFQWA